MVDGVDTSTSIPSNVSSGRRRSVAALIPDAARSASSTTAGTANAMLDDPPLETLVELTHGVVTVTVTVWRVAATGTIVRVSVVAPSGV